MIPRSAWTSFIPTCPSANPSDRLGSALHYTGSVGSTVYADHDDCMALVQRVEREHLASPEGYGAIAYNLVCCHHGHLIEGRGVHRQSGANGTAEANMLYGSILLMLGTRDEPNAAMKLAVLRGAKILAPSHPHRFRPHSFFVPTACPGDPTRAWIVAGCPKPGVRHRLLIRYRALMVEVRRLRRRLFGGKP